MGRLLADADPVLGLAELTLLGDDLGGGAQIIHSLFSVLVGPYNTNWSFFGCRRELLSEGLPAITNILVAFFGALRAVNSVSLDDHRVHVEGVPPSGWQTMPCERATSKEEGRSLS